MEVCNIVQEVVIKTIPKRKKCKKEKWLSEEALQIAEKRRKGKGKGERERYTHLNAEFQIIAARDNEITQSCPTLCRRHAPGSSVHGILQARVLEWGAISFSRGYSRPRD